MADYSVRQVTDAAQLRALAHPLRQRLYEQLVLFGPLTATELAERVDDSPSNCSWHLRKLAEHGFAEEAPGGTGRQRPWRAATQGLRWQDDAGDEDARRAGDALSRMMLERELQRLDEARHRLPGDAEIWREAAETTQSLLWLTAEELAAINDEVRRLLLSAVDRHEHPDRRPPGSRLCAFLAWGVPTYDLADPTPGAPDGPR